MYSAAMPYLGKPRDIHLFQFIHINVQVTGSEVMEVREQGGAKEHNEPKLARGKHVNMAMAISFVPMTMSYH